MCDYSLEHVKSRAANVGDKLVSHQFGYTRGFAAPEATDTAVCVLPGTEIGFDAPIQVRGDGHYDYDKAIWIDGEPTVTEFAVAVFTQINTDQKYAHHDAIELPNGKKILLHELVQGQTGSILQLPAQPLVQHVELPAVSEAVEPGPTVEAVLTLAD